MLMTIVRRAAAVIALAIAWPALAFEILGVQTAAIDQPQVTVQLRRPSDPTTPLGVEIFPGLSVTNFSAYFDTGASGVVLSESTASSFGVMTSPGVTFSDFAIGGATTFGVAEPLYFDVGPFSFAQIFDPFANPFADPAYPQKQFGPIRAQVGPVNQAVDPLLEELGISLATPDVLGIPTMSGAVVVMDPKPLNAFDPLSLEGMRTFVYEPGAAFKSDSDPGIPQTNRTIALSFASFDRFTQLDPSGADGPTQGSNPFVGPNPLNPVGDDTPGVTLELGDKKVTGSFLLDTGASASIISTKMAEQLGVRYRPGTTILEFIADGTDVPDQFQITLGGLGGSEAAAGLYLEALVVPTKEGDPLRFINVPILVADITLIDPLLAQDDPQKFFTLDGVLGMNLFVASVFFSDDFLETCLDLSCLLGLFENINPSPFNWIVFDQPNAVLALNVEGIAPAAVPEPASLPLVLIGLILAAWRFRRPGGRCWRV